MSGCWSMAVFSETMYNSSLAQTWLVRAKGKRRAKKGGVCEHMHMEGEEKHVMFYEDGMWK